MSRKKWYSCMSSVKALLREFRCCRKVYGTHEVDCAHPGRGKVQTGQVGIRILKSLEEARTSGGRGRAKLQCSRHRLLSPDTPHGGAAETLACAKPVKDW